MLVWSVMRSSLVSAPQSTTPINAKASLAEIRRRWGIGADCTPALVINDLFLNLLYNGDASHVIRLLDEMGTKPNPNDLAPRGRMHPEAYTTYSIFLGKSQTKTSGRATVDRTPLHIGDCSEVDHL